MPYTRLRLTFLFTLLSCLLASNNASAQSATGSVTDVLTGESLGLSLGYSKFTSSQFTSGHTYSGYATKGTSEDENLVRLKNDKSNYAGIVTTKGEKKLLSIKTTWNSQTNPNAQIQIYGKTSAYKSSADLYSSSSTKGTLIATLSQSDTSAEISGDYAYIGILNSSTGSYTSYLESISLEWESDEVVILKDPQLAYSETAVSVALGSTLSAPALTHEENFNGEVTYTSSNTSVATIDSEGIITPLGAGKTTITAAFNGNDEYKASTASFVLTVTAAEAPASYLFKKVTSQDEIVDNGIYIITSLDGSLAMGGATGSYRKRIEVTDESGYIRLSQANATGYPYYFAIRKRLRGYYGMQLSDGSYLIHPKQGGAITKGNDTTEEGNDKYQWSITFAEDGCNIASRLEPDRSIANNIDSQNFSCIKNTSFAAGYYELIALYRLIGNAYIKTDEGYSTLYCDKAIEIPEGLTATTVSGIADETLSTPWQYGAGKIVPPYTGLLIKGNKGAYDYAIIDSDEGDAGTNLLRGTLTDQDIATEEDTHFYRLTYSDAYTPKVLGFYWGAADGGSFRNNGGKAYLAVPVSYERGSNGFSFGGFDNVTGINAADTATNNETTEIYTLFGTRVKGDATTLSPGLYIINGKKTVIR